MCIVAVKPKDRVFTHKELQTMWDGNSDGAGFMYAHEGKLRISKGHMTLKSLEDALEQHGPEREMVLHFRIRTHGDKIAALTHPFPVIPGELGMAHNGIIWQMFHEVTNKVSDTLAFVNFFKVKFPNALEFVRNERSMARLGSMIQGSKLVFMEGDGSIHYVNKQDGVETEDGCWYSNDGFRERSWGFSSGRRWHFGSEEGEEYTWPGQYGLGSGHVKEND